MLAAPSQNMPPVCSLLPHRAPHLPLLSDTDCLACVQLASQMPPLACQRTWSQPCAVPQALLWLCWLQLGCDLAHLAKHAVAADHAKWRLSIVQKFCTPPRAHTVRAEVPCCPRGHRRRTAPCSPAAAQTMPTSNCMAHQRMGPADAALISTWDQQLLHTQRAARKLERILNVNPH